MNVQPQRNDHRPRWRWQHGNADLQVVSARLRRANAFLLEAGMPPRGQ